jgi:hypothetical protein
VLSGNAIVFLKARIGNQAERVIEFSTLISVPLKDKIYAVVLSLGVDVQ